MGQDEDSLSRPGFPGRDRDCPGQRLSLEERREGAPGARGERQHPAFWVLGVAHQDGAGVLAASMESPPDPPL